ncbi:MAG TPA: iron permease [Deltaproteobacteria bacterium]|nr:MAG: hypothetical protein A2Z79_00615 [Deltaproteobacteria bacterium GWA2_55_82]OGQ64882.1 MAG: hypothetical protein A3I81_04725 [Deltaproteobacteria bacterium RIFCSPLOWO2_02_FULL_55_12]OIJ73949.1 MAG: hypothetical protein A2V21_306520 [Deltaproteobacteria bacterium GWC2_55_46]HBG46545.1 iron permease [Deltaproteobacteria bacterium]HCY09947.1 iron permease [Deltaproteobacteria bacterium]
MLKTLFSLFAAAFLALFPLVQACQAGEGYANALTEIETNLDKALESHKAGETSKAKAYVTSAYFDSFEGSGLENALGAVSPSDKTEIEAIFGRITGQIRSGEAPEKVDASIDELMERVRAGAASLEKGSRSGHLSLFFNSMLIIVREGFEAILIISALAAYLVKTGKAEKVRVVYSGGVLAIVASLLFAAVFQLFFSAAGAGREALEGITMLLATAVLFYVSYWLISKARAARWQRYIKSSVEGALSRGNIYTLWFAAFIAVFREGAETVLFYQALYSSASGGLGYLLGGVGVGTVILAVIFLLFRYGTVKIPLGQFFTVTSALLYYLAFSFSGKGVLELQGAGWLSTTPVAGMPSVGFLGIYPSWEGLSIQIFLVLAMLAALAYSLLLRPYMERGRMLGEVAHIASDISGLHGTLDHIRQHALLCQELSVKKDGSEVVEIKGHLKDIDSKVHEVMDHLEKLEEAFSDVFKDIERTIKK